MLLYKANLCLLSRGANWLFILIILFLFSFPVYGIKGTGGQPGAFLSWGAGARSLGMGKAFVGLADDASASYWNPAGLAQMDRREITALHALLWAGTIYDFISYVHPVAGVGTVGISGTRLYLGGFEGRDKDNFFTHRFEDIQSAYGISYGKQIIDTLALGLNLKYMSHSLDNHINGNYILDAGMIFKPPLRNLQFGLNLQNILAIKTGEDTLDELPINIRIGLNFKAIRNRLNLNADLETTKGVNRFHFGTEYWALSTVALRMGMDSEEFTLGFGVRYRDYSVDYAFATHPLGGSHRFSATLRFGPSITIASEIKARQYFDESIIASEHGLYLKAVEKLNLALRLEPKNEEIIRKLERLEKIAKIIPYSTGEEKEAQLIRKGITAYLQGDTQTLVNVLLYLRSINPENRQVLNLINVMKSEKGVVIPEVPTTKGMNLIDEKLYKALDYFYEGKYNLVVKECQDVITLDPNNALAYKRIGSAYFAMGDKIKAKQAWEKSLQLNPKDETLIRYLNELKKELGEE